MAKLADNLVQRIRNADPSVIEELESIDNPCIEDGEQCSLLAAAVRAGNDAAVDALLGHSDVLEYVPALPADEQNVLKQTSSLMSMDNIDELEAYVSKPFGGLSNFERTPLLEACRFGNLYAVEQLLAAGARADATDVLGETALSLAAYRGIDFLGEVAGRLADGTFDVDETLLTDAAGHPDVYDKLLRHGRLDEAASDLAFCLACARLDTDAIRQRLASGYSLERKRPIHRDPVLETLTSELLVDVGHPDRDELAAGLVRVFDKSGADPVPMPAGQVDERLSVVDLLLDNGLNPRQGNPRDAMVFLDRLIATNEPALIEKSHELGIAYDKGQLDWDNRIEFAIRHRCFAVVAALRALGVKPPKTTGRAFDDYLEWCEQHDVEAVQPAEGKKKAKKTAAEPVFEIPVDLVPGFKAIWNAPSSWELVGESRLQAARIVTDEGAVLRLTYSNLYGPVDGVTLAVRYRRNPWKDAVLVEEIVDIDGDTVLRSEAGDLVGETPWDATFDIDYPLPKGEFVMEIQVSSPAEGIDPPQVIDDWLVRVDKA